MTDDDFYDEEDDEEEPEPSPDSWLLIGHDGENGRWWAGKCPVVDQAADILMTLQELDEEQIDWATLLKDLPRLQCLPEMSFPPFSHIQEFESYFDEFLLLPMKVDGDTYGHRLYLTADEPEKTGPLLAELAELTRRLKEYPPLAPYL